MTDIILLRYLSWTIKVIMLKVMYWYSFKNNSNFFFFCNNLQSKNNLNLKNTLLKKTDTNFCLTLKKLNLLNQSKLRGVVAREREKIAATTRFQKIMFNVWEFVLHSRSCIKSQMHLLHNLILDAFEVPYRSYKKGIPKSFAKFTGIYPYCNLLYNKVSYPQLPNLSKIDSGGDVFV